MTWPAPTRQDHEAFCKTEGWQPVRDARGKAGTHHVTYELHLHDGRILRTRISHPVDRDTYGPRMWAHILRDQLDVDEAVFWACVQDGTRPDRGTPEPPSMGLPADLVHLLLTRAHLSEAEVAAMSKEQAIARMQQYWATGS
ncbi:MAG TPA: cytotoxic translational repressor of toxin-antitoxin stability system [Streptosporangiaceae bacterium]|nr:cytotoxic translational repressor of toxin-antitoxin stability system [Streptosporangiaceae bacterium]